VQIRRIVRRALIVQSIILATITLMVGLIHLAPVGATVPPIVVNTETTYGYVKFVANPWAEVFVDGESIGFTPMAKEQKIAVGTHTITLKNEEINQTHKETIEVAKGAPEDAILFRVDLDKDKRD
jgi:serine/threonine-protein kinase